MAKSNKSIGSASRKKVRWTDPDDAPPLTRDFFARATLNKSGKPVRGRPKIAEPKKSVSLRLDQDVVEAFKSRGEGWQTAINLCLRKAAGLKPSRGQAGTPAAKKTARASRPNNG